jgi:DNA mismatch repair protein MutL
VALALDHADAFAKLGFEHEAFGDSCLLVRAAPEGVAPDRAADLFRALLEELRESDAAESLTADPTRLSAKIERMIATAACHGSVRAGQALSQTEAQRLAAELDATPASLNCPHGRPASVRLTFEQIEGLFKRG